MTAKLTIQNLTKNFGEKEVLKGINLSVNKGDSVVILGGSGSGKSVLIKIKKNKTLRYPNIVIALLLYFIASKLQK